MSNDNKTLADAQPGGRVRLGDQAERARFEEWYVQNAFDYEANPIGSRDCALMRKAWNAALSAQPSPGGQAAHCPVKHCGMTYARVPSDGRCHACGAPVQPSPGATALGIPIVVDSTVPPDTFEVRRPSPGGQDALKALVARWRAEAAAHELNGLEADSIGLTVAAMRNDARHHVLEAAADELEAALAARQPVTMDDALAAGDGTLHGAIDHWQERALRAEAELAARQPVGEPRTDLVPGVVRCAKCAFQLHRTTLYLQSGTVGSGDSKTEPCPNGCGPLWPVTWETWAREGWAEAERLHMEKAAAPPAQAVDLGQFRDVVADWRDRCCRAADKNTIVNVAKADRLLALIDKAVGNG